MLNLDLSAYIGKALRKLIVFVVSLMLVLVRAFFRLLESNSAIVLIRNLMFANLIILEMVKENC